MKKGLIVILVILGIACLAGGVYTTLLFKKDVEKQTVVEPTPTTPEPTQSNPITTTGDFNVDIIRAVNANEMGNYLISPYSIEYALAMLKEGASGTTLEEFNKVLPSRNINTLSVKNRVTIANALFIKDKYKNSIKTDFSNTLKTKYSSEILYDKFTEPTVINNWANEKTMGMIKEVVKSLDPNFVLGIANALAIDVEWAHQFDCISTQSGDFTVDGVVKKVEMMHESYNNYSGVKYISIGTDIGVIDVTGVVLPYASYNSDGTKANESSNTTTDLEFIALLPTKDVNTYVSELTKEKLNDIVTKGLELTDKQELHLSLPRFEYDYDFNTFKSSLSNMGLKEAMSTSPNYSNIMDPNVEKLYVGQAVHKTHISLNEKGTKAAAITFFGMETMGIPEEKTTIEINFNKPFIYMIRDKKSGELLFFGVVKQPNEWKGSTCSSEK